MESQHSQTAHNRRSSWSVFPSTGALFSCATWVKSMTPFVYRFGGHKLLVGYLAGRLAAA